MFLCACLCTFSVLLCVFLWCYLDYISANSFCSAFLNGSSPLKNRFLCCSSSIFAPKVLLQRIEVSLVAWSLHWLFAIFTNVNCLCGNFENDYVKSLKVLVWTSWFGTVNWTIYFSTTPFCWYVDACWSVFAPDYSYFWSCCCSEAAFDWLQLITNFVCPLLACLIFGVVCFVGLSKQCWFQELFWWVKIVVKLLNFWRPVVAKLLWWHLLLWKLESVEGCDLGFLVVGENWQYNNCKIVDN